jgi:hypothetical protein
MQEVSGSIPLGSTKFSHDVLLNAFPEKAGNRICVWKCAKTQLEQFERFNLNSSQSNENIQTGAVWLSICQY